MRVVRNFQRFEAMVREDGGIIKANKSLMSAPQSGALQISASAAASAAATQVASLGAKKTQTQCLHTRQTERLHSNNAKLMNFHIKKHKCIKKSTSKEFLKKKLNICNPNNTHTQTIQFY